MNERPRILVVTATLGKRDTLSRTIEAVRNIGREYVQHVIIAPLSCLDSMQRRYGDDIIYEAEPAESKGIYTALNHGFRKFGKDYDYLTFINDDDYWLPTYRTLIDYILNHEECDLVYARTLYVNEKNETICEQTSSGRFRDFIPLLRQNIPMMTQQATILRSSLYFDIGGFDETYRLVADTKLWALLSLKTVCYKFFNKCCAAYTIQDGQLSSDHATQSAEHKRLFGELPSYSKLKCLSSKILFRLQNWPIYFKRAIQGKAINNPFMWG